MSQTSGFNTGGTSLTRLMLKVLLGKPVHLRLGGRMLDRLGRWSRRHPGMTADAFGQSTPM